MDPTVQNQSPHLLPQQQLQQQQPQDVLAEARKNLQMLMEAGLSRDQLHQLLDTQMLQTLAEQNQQPTQQQPQQQPQQQQHQQQQQSQQQQTPDHSSIHPQQLQSQLPALAIPPMPQCPPPPPPTAARQVDQQQRQQPAVISPVSQNSTTPLAAPTNSSILRSDMKPPLPRTDDGTATLFSYPPPNAPFAHRPRFSVSSTSSGSSGHASVFSNMSSHSAMSWASAGTNGPRSQAPLPMPPQITSPTGQPVITGGSTSAPGSLNKQNIYWCTSCETSFKRKYDWKRHEDEFHERWRKYPCPEPGCNRSFWGSNSFNQHHKQCHGCTTCPHAEKVVRFLRKRKYWACGFCSALHPARERHVEHVARHFESGMTKGEWMHSRVVYGLLHQPLIREAWGSLISSKQSSYSGRRPRFSWHPSKTGRAQGFLEKENPGQLQDLLEFFSGNEGEAEFIASVAYDLADIVMDNIQLTPPPFPGQPQGMQQFQDPRMSFNPMPPQPPPQQVMSNGSPNAHTSYASAYQTPMMMPSQQYTRPNGPSSPDSTGHSPMTANHSPLTANHSPLTANHSPIPSTHSIKQEHPHSTAPSMEGSDGVMDFDYSPAPVVFDDWESMHNQSIDEATSGQPTAQPGWGMMQYFADPRVNSS